MMALIEHQCFKRVAFANRIPKTRDNCPNPGDQLRARTSVTKSYECKCGHSAQLSALEATSRCTRCGVNWLLTGETEDIIIEYLPLNRMLWDYEQQVQRSVGQTSHFKHELDQAEKRIKEIKTDLHQMETASRADQIDQRNAAIKHIAKLENDAKRLAEQLKIHEDAAEQARSNIAALKERRQSWRLPASLEGVEIEVKGVAAL